jgi:putative solute:sodium symporter small subunit
MICLVIWFIVSFLFGIILVDALNAIQIGGYKLGFWFAQQGSIYTFVVLIFFYAWRMGKLDRQFNVQED